MSDQEVMFYMAALVLALLAAFLLVALIVFSAMALNDKLNGGCFFESLLFHWDNS